MRVKFDDKNFGTIAIGRQVAERMDAIRAKHRKEGCPICCQLDLLLPQPGEDYELKVSYKPHIMDDVVRQGRVSHSSAKGFYEGVKGDNKEVKMLCDCYTTGISINRINPKQFYKTEVTWFCCWSCFRWRLNLVGCRIRDAWLVLIGKAVIP